jgi:hypothetical protein
LILSGFAIDEARMREGNAGVMLQAQPGDGKVKRKGADFSWCLVDKSAHTKLCAAI